MVLHLDEKHVAVAVESDFVRLIELRIGRESAIARVPFASTASDRFDPSIAPIQFQHPMILDFRDIKRAVRRHFNSKGLSNVYFGGESCVAIILRLARSSDRRYLSLVF